MKIYKIKTALKTVSYTLSWIALTGFLFTAVAREVPPDTPDQTIRILSSLEDRGTGTPGCRKAAAYIRSEFEALGLEDVGTHRFSVPVLRHEKSHITLIGQNKTCPLHPIRGNAITPETIPPEGLEGPLLYVGRGELPDFNGKEIAGAVILMELDSGKNWLHAANFGAKALIYVERGDAPRSLYQEKEELSPIQFPRFRLTAHRAREMFGLFEHAPDGLILPGVLLRSDIRWQPETAENIYGIIPGSDPALGEEMVMAEAFYDSTAWVPGLSPGADEAIGIATLLELARFLKAHPPGRAVMLVATAGHAQALAGMREMIWSLRSRASVLRKEEKRLRAIGKNAREMLDALEAEGAGRLRDAVADRIKTETDTISRRLMALRMKQKSEQDADAIRALASDRLRLRRLGWRADFIGLSPEEKTVLGALIPNARADYRAILSDVDRQIMEMKSAKRFRSIVKKRELMATVSLHLSGHGDGVGAFNYGWLYAIKPHISRIAPYSAIDEILRAAATEIEKEGTARYRDTLRPSPLRSWQSYFADRPPLGGEVSALAGYLGLTLATVHDARPAWGTPGDLPEKIDEVGVRRQSDLVCGLIRALANAPELLTESAPRNGFATVTAQASLLRHGELFPDQAAPGTMILAYQGQGRFHAMTDATGRFQLRGMATKKLVPDKVIIEGYRFDPATGDVVRAIDKKQTGKAAYRVKMQRKSMETRLVMFGCRQTTLFNLLEPRNFRYMTKIQLLDGRREALPLRYWYSRIDTRSSTISSVYLEPGTWLKLTHSDTVLRRKMVLLNGTDDNPHGTGYRVDDWPMLTRTDFRVARDMWTLLRPRIRNLEAHGIFSERINALQADGTTALRSAEAALKARRYDRFAELSARSWALASRVYNHVEETRKDVLFGVLFYIALFVPFAFCMERLIFCYSDIHKRILAFLAILLLLIFVIYRIHPAFQLAYSPTVVILAFFIMGLSLMVTLIIFFRFEKEMVLLQRRASQMRAEEISRWKAFVAAFFLGVSNLRRRRLRTALTCATLVILTFTIMSFTSVRTTRHHARLLLGKSAPWQGFLLKNVNWTDLPPEALGIIANAFEKRGAVAPRAWLEDADRTRTVPIPLRCRGRVYEARGMVGLSADEPQVTGLERILTGGRWFRPGERNAILLPERIAEALGIDPRNIGDAQVSLWGVPFQVAGVFSGKALEAATDLDGEFLTPVTFPGEVSAEMTEAEMEALESGDDVRAFQSRYQHIAGNLTVIVPCRTLMANGGHLKAVAIRPAGDAPLRETARRLTDRFGLTLFSGEPEGRFMDQASDAISYSGVPNILIPLIISVFIVLNTMIGSVYERKREIGIYTSVGLAPSHVSFLFIAEALAFAVISVVLGYLLAQISASLFSGTALWGGITVNYSSLAGVASMLLVIVVVLVSVIYPSRVAAEIAIPDVNRSWSLPHVSENTIGLTLPFLVKYHEHDSIAGFILAWFQGHKDVSHGLFSTDRIDTRFMQPLASASGPSCIHLSSRVWLAPFDFGIMQQVDVRFCVSGENRGFLEIEVRLVRETGEANAWRRINKAFLNALRKQLLVWRSMDEAARKEYEALLTDL
ncbi:peptide ABC transporter permease [Desulfonema ishimotonii]|uniref:Peptide ABC transporter permease n=1 Tax=Desulfonema ishimotonii TaxID=45657 RepID=A0A401G1W9_9BACT|nr:FtsX-like permease family protein [Desulfonema ishimotonii]GBC63219.1 peptide ABC transporter permease [Desulfonema ishimotonii]